MINTVSVVAVVVTDQENIDPLVGIITTVQGVALAIRVTYIKEFARNKRWSRGLQRSNTEKIKSLLYFIDGVQPSFTLSDTIIKYLSSVGNVGLAGKPP